MAGAGLRLAAVVLAAALALTGCGGSTPREPKTVAAPAGVSVSVLQYRSDYSIRQLEIKVTNGGRTPITVLAARLDSASFAGTVTWLPKGPTDIAVINPGEATDLPAPLPASACPGSSPAPIGTARLDLRQGDSSTGRTPALAVSDPFGYIGQIHTQDCRRAAAFAIVGITLPDPLRTRRQDGHLVGLLDLRLTPTGRPGTVTVDTIAPTTLIQPSGADAWPVHADAGAGTGPRTVTLEIYPARCDLHAIAEDKLGTVLPLTLRVNGGSAGEVDIVSGQELRGQIQDFVAAACRG